MKIGRARAKKEGREYTTSGELPLFGYVFTPTLSFKKGPAKLKMLKTKNE
jgi:hypothetical protein